MLRRSLLLQWPWPRITKHLTTNPLAAPIELEPPKRPKPILHLLRLLVEPGEGDRDIVAPAVVGVDVGDIIAFDALFLSGMSVRAEIVLDRLA